MKSSSVVNSIWDFAPVVIDSFTHARPGIFSLYICILEVVNHDERYINNTLSHKKAREIIDRK